VRVQEWIPFSKEHNLLGGFPLFPLCMLGGLLIQLFADKFDRAQTIDVGLIRRIQNCALDYLVVAAIATIRVDVIVAGGAGSGKTTLLNALSMFIPKTDRVISVEDTLELNLEFIENWVPLEASPSVTEASEVLSMHSVLKNSLRMRPDRVIVGEVRGAEAETLFVAMDIGLDGSMGTLHANNARETTIRLMGEPMNVPLRMMSLLNLIVVMNRIFDRKRGMMSSRRLMLKGKLFSAFLDSRDIKTKSHWPTKNSNRLITVLS